MKTPDGNTSATFVAAETERRGELVLRTLPIVIVPLLVSIAIFVLLRITLGDTLVPPSDRPPSPFSPLVPIIVITIFFSALITLVRIGRPTISALLLIGAWTLATTLAALQNGVTSIWPALLIMPICAAGLLIDAVATVTLAALATLFVASLAWLEFNGLHVGTADVPPFIAQNQPFVSVIFWVTVFWSVAALTSLLAGGLQRALSQSREQAQALSTLSGELEERVQAQTAKLVAQERAAAALDERQRVARDIHDTLAQGLTAVVVQLGAAERALDLEPEEARQHLVLARGMARESLTEARRSIWNLRAPVLQRGELGDALRGLAERSTHARLAIAYTQRGAPWALAPEAEAALLRVAQEALVNVARHADATHAEVALEYDQSGIRLSISDDGRGFSAGALDAAPAGPESGFGVLGMRERIAALGGTLTLTSDTSGQDATAVPRRGAEGGEPSASGQDATGLPRRGAEGGEPSASGRDATSDPRRSAEGGEPSAGAQVVASIPRRTAGGRDASSDPRRSAEGEEPSASGRDASSDPRRGAEGEEPSASGRDASSDPRRGAEGEEPSAGAAPAQPAPMQPAAAQPGNAA